MPPTWLPKRPPATRDHPERHQEIREWAAGTTISVRPLLRVHWMGTALGVLMFVAGSALWLLAPGLEKWFAQILHLAANSRFVPAAVFLTGLGGATAMVPAALLGAGLLIARGQAATALWVFGVIGSGRLVIELIKVVVGRARPEVAYRLVEVTSASFPSSHAAGTALTFATLLYAFHAPRWAGAVAAAWTMLIGCTRIMVGVHFPSDVLAGWGIGLAWGSVLSALLPGDVQSRPGRATQD